MGAALKAQENGASVALVERNPRLGGILLQCIHSGFGLRLFKKELTGPEYAQRFINRLKDTGVKVFLSTMVLRITPDREVVCMNETGITVIRAKAVVLAMGCRERTRGKSRFQATAAPAL